MEWTTDYLRDMGQHHASNTNTIDIHLLPFKMIATNNTSKAHLIFGPNFVEKGHDHLGSKM